MQRDLTPHDLTTTTRRRLGRGLTAAVASLALIAGVGIAGTVMASAETVPYDVDFSPTVVPTGGITQAYLDCDNDIGATAAISAVAPDGTVRTGSQVIGSLDNNNQDQRIFLNAGPGELIDTQEAGTWTITVTCPSYDPITKTLQVLVPSLAFSARLDSDYDCATTDDYFGVGTGRLGVPDGEEHNRLRGQPGRMGLHERHGLRVPRGGRVPGRRDPHRSHQPAERHGSRGGTVDGLQVWLEVGTSPTGDFYTTACGLDRHPGARRPAHPQRDDRSRPASACEGNGGIDWRDSGASEVEVYVCYHVRNQSGVDFVSHDLTDSALGTLFDGKSLEIKSNTSYDWVTPSKVTVSADTVFAATWVAEPDHYYSSLPEDYVATATGSATVLIDEAAEPTDRRPRVRPRPRRRRRPHRRPPPAPSPAPPPRSTTRSTCRCSPSPPSRRTPADRRAEPPGPSRATQESTRSCRRISSGGTVALPVSGSTRPALQQASATPVSNGPEPGERQ